VLRRLRERQEWKFFAVLPKAAAGLALTWWAILLLRGLLPVVFGIAMGMVVGAVQQGADFTGPLALVGASFVLLQVLTPIHLAVSSNLGDRTAGWLFDPGDPASLAHALETAFSASDQELGRRADRAAAQAAALSWDESARRLAALLRGRYT